MRLKFKTVVSCGLWVVSNNKNSTTDPKPMRAAVTMSGSTEESTFLAMMVSIDQKRVAARTINSPGENFNPGNPPKSVLAAKSPITASILAGDNFSLRNKIAKRLTQMTRVLCMMAPFIAGIEDKPVKNK